MAAERDATLEQAAQTLKSDWVKGGSAAPAEPTPPPAPPAPPPAPVAPAASEPTVQVRRADGTFGPKTPADALPPGTQPVQRSAPAPAAPAAAAAPAAGATAAEVQDFIEAMLGEGLEPLRIPRTAKLPRKVQGQTEYVTVDDMLRGGMREQDYIRKTQGVADRLRELEERDGEIAAREARMAAREKFLQEQEQMLRDANTSQEGYDAFQQHLRAMESNPRYKQMVTDALAKRETEAENETFRARSHAAARDRGVEAVLDWIGEFAADPKYAHVDPERVRAVYGTLLREERVPLDRREVHRIFEAEAQYLSKSLTPLQSEVAELRAQVAALTGQQAGAQRHNAQTAHAVQRGGVVPTAPVGGSPPAPAAPGPVAPFGIRDLPDRNRDWVNRGR